MRLNKYIALATGLSRRGADDAIAADRVMVNSQPAKLGHRVAKTDLVTLDGQTLNLPATQTIMLNKPVGYVVSRNRQGNDPTIYELLPPELHHLKPVGRLDKNSSGLLLLTNDGQLAESLTHPGQQKIKVYQVTLDRELAADDLAKLNNGVELKDGISHLKVKPTGECLEVTMSEGRNRQIRRTFGALDYTVRTLQRVQFGDYKLGNLKPREFKIS